MFDHHKNKNEISKMPVSEKTIARSAEEELDKLLYDGQFGLYKNRQFAFADTMTLHTTYDEIFILWECQAVFRQGFSVEKETITLPMLFVNIAGVEEENIKNYWKKIDSLVVANTHVINKTKPFTHKNTGGIQTFVDAINYLTYGWLKNGRLQRNKIIQHTSYRYGYLNVDIQNRIFDKLQLLLDGNLIRKTKQNNEMKVIAAVLQLDASILTLLQKFDFTKDIPKLIYVNTSKNAYTFEEAVRLVFLNLMGFDIALVTPTGYKTVEDFYNYHIVNQYHVGEYMENLTMPKWITSNLSSKKRSIFAKWLAIFKNL